MRGVVEFFDERRGFGRIQPADGSQACFAHCSQIADKSEQVLVLGEEVDFDVVSDPKGPQARSIVRVDSRRRGRVKTFDKGFGFIKPDDGTPDLFVHFSDIATSGYRRLEPAEDVSFVTLTDAGRPKAVRVRRLDTRLPFEKFAVAPKLEAQLADLATLAQKEEWDYRFAKSTKSYPVLRSFIRFFGDFRDLRG